MVAGGRTPNFKLYSIGAREQPDLNSNRFRTCPYTPRRPHISALRGRVSMAGSSPFAFFYPGEFQ
jgi:hypothetical protein